MRLPILQYLVVFLVFLAASSTHASVEEQGAVVAPDELVQSITDTLVVQIASYRDAVNDVDQEAEKEALLQDFYHEITSTLEPVVDFNWISLNVMGEYRKQASSEQRKQFKKVFTRGLVETYGRGLLTYSDQQIVVFPLSESDKGKRKVVVNQEIRNRDQAYPLQYSMGLNRNGKWKVINVIINGINLGQTFRNQFVQAAAKYDGDIDKVIANWAAARES